MNIRIRARLLAAVLLSTCIPPTLAQEPPAVPPPPASTETPAAPQAAPPAESAATPASEPAAATPDATATAPLLVAESATPRTGAKRILVLPVEFTVYQKSIAGIEAVPDWTETAQFALGDAATQMLQQDSRFQIVPLPKVDGEPAALLREHIELFKIVASTVTDVVQYGKVWEPKRTTNFDYSIGNGLTFLADAADADYAFLIAGAQVKQTGGSIFAQVLLGTPGGGTYVMAGIADLRSGEIRWLNARLGFEMFGMTGTDVREPGVALEIVARMFEGFPLSKYATFRQF